MNTDVLKPRDWVYAALAFALLLTLKLFSQDIWQALPTALMQGLMLGLSAAAWCGYFVLREKRAVWADILALAGACLFHLIPSTTFSLPQVLIKGSAELIMLIMPFIARLRLLIIFPMLATAALPTAIMSSGILRDTGNAAHTYGTALSFLVLFIWWLVGMRWRIGRGAYRSYAWVGLAAYVTLLLLLKDYVSTHTSPENSLLISGANSLVSGAIICAAPLLFLLLRPHEGWQLLWPFYVATCAALGACVSFHMPTLQPIAMLATAYGALLCYISVRKRNDHMLLYGAATIGVVVYATISSYLSDLADMGKALIFMLSVGGAAAVSLLLYYRVASSFLPKPQQEESTSFPGSKRRHILLSCIIGLQIAGVGGLFLFDQYRIFTAPRIHMEADWVSDDTLSTLWYDALLEVGAVHPLQDDSFFGKSLWWQQPGAYRPCPADVTNPREVRAGAYPIPVSAFLREGEDGLWSISRVEAEYSSEDAPHPGELRVKAVLQIGTETAENAPRNVICTLPIRFEIMRVMQKAISPEHAGYPFAEADFTVELVVPSESTIIVSEIYMNGLPLREALKQLPRPDYGNH